MIYQPEPIGRVCRDCGLWFPRALLRKNKGQPDGVEKQCLSCCHQQTKKWANNHPDQMRQSRKKWRDTYPERQYAAQKRCRAADPDRYRAIDNRWSKNHPDKARAKVAKRRTRLLELDSTFTDDDWAFALDYWHGACAYCGRGPSLFDKTHVLTQDHFIPVTQGGHYTPDNIVPACKSCNSQKWNRAPREWLTSKFGQRKANAKLHRIESYFAWVESR